ncbi:MAG TPA: GyrI-like domain-containing protein, partial [bacterium]|nr:GyrI-like domain-containing protein [bacterium]
MLHFKRQLVALLALTCAVALGPATRADDLLASEAHHNFSIQPVSPVKYMGLRVTASMDQMMQVVTAGYEELYQYLMANHLTPAGPPFAIYDMADPNAQVWDFELAVPVIDTAAGTPRITPRSLEATEAAVVEFTGPYEALMEIYPRLYAWIEEQGRVPGGPPREVYVVNPGDTDDPAQWQTIVQVPLAPATGEPGAMPMQDLEGQDMPMHDEGMEASAPEVEITMGEPQMMEEELPVPSYHITVKRAEPVHYAGIMMRASAADIANAFPTGLTELSNHLARYRIRQAGMPFNIWHDTTNAPADYRFELAIPVSDARDIPAEGAIRGTVLPGAKVASIVHVGPYDQLPGAYLWLY